MKAEIAAITFVSVLMIGVPLPAQTSSIGAKQRQRLTSHPPQVAPREARRIARNKVYDRYAWTSARPKKPKSFKIGDLITVIVREQRSFDAESDLELKKRITLDAEIKKFIDLTNGGIGASAFSRGRPGIGATLNSRLKNEGDAGRDDTLTLRMTGKIIDIKPNGTLVLEGKARVQHDTEAAVMTLTGTCRKEDVTADNTILSTQLADKSIRVDNQGALRDVTKRGWLFRLMEFFRPI